VSFLRLYPTLSTVVSGTWKSTVDIQVSVASVCVCSQCCCLNDRDLTLTIGTDIVAVADAVHVLGILFTPDLALEKHATSVSTKCFYQLRQLRRVRRSLDHDSATTLVHAFVTSCIDYCNSLFANAPKIWIDKLQRVMNAAARVISSTRKFDRGLTRFLRDDLQWYQLPTSWRAANFTLPLKDY